MATEGVIMRELTLEECPWLDNPVPKGKGVYRFGGATYGCISDDGVAVSDIPDGEFYEVPRDAVTFESEKTRFCNERRFEHLSHNGTRFIAERCDLQGGFQVTVPANLTQEQLMQDVAEVSAFHGEHIVPRLNGFHGYRVEYRITRS